MIVINNHQKYNKKLCFFMAFNGKKKKIEVGKVK